MEQQKIKTEFRMRKEARELAIYDEYNSLMAQPGAMATAIDRYLTRKYGFGSESTIWLIRKRVEKRLREEGRA